MKRTAFVLATLLVLGLAQLPVSAEAPAPNSIDNETIDTNHNPQGPRHSGDGIYDHYDKYLTPQGFPLPGWGHLRGMS
ncbi:MAG TPA: hypothetical protein VGF92_21040 [Stellaceae bacterium]